MRSHTALLIIPNRDAAFQLPADDWYHIAPIGEFPHSQGVVQVIDAQACASMANSFRDMATKAGASFPGVLIDFDHGSLDTDKSSRAAGWILDLQNRDDGLWAKIRWSKSGRDAVEGGDFRFLSPVWNRADCEEVGDNRVRPLRLKNAAVTNDPNLKGILALSNRADDLAKEGTPGGGILLANPDWVMDEELWEKAKQAALKDHDEGDENFYAIVTAIYKKMGGTIQNAGDLDHGNRTNSRASVMLRNGRVLTEKMLLAMRNVTRWALANAGTSEGARKGWETRKRGGGGADTEEARVAMPKQVADLAALAGSGKVVDAAAMVKKDFAKADRNEAFAKKWNALSGMDKTKMRRSLPKGASLMDVRRAFAKKWADKG